MNGLDRHITGNWGEDSVTPDSIKARELGNFADGAGVVIDATSHTGTETVPVTVESVIISWGNVYVTTTELAWPLMIPEDATVWFAEKV